MTDLPFQKFTGILLYGPPGTGKTFIAKAVASMVEGTFFFVSSSDLVSKWMGESEKLVRELFKMASANKPAIIFIDEVDAIASKREEGQHEASRRIKNEFLIQMQEILDSEGVLVLGATNRPWDLDPAVRRRFEKRIYIPLPDKEARQFLLKSHLGEEGVKLTDQELARLSVLSEGYSGADLSIVAREALMMPVRRCVKASRWEKVGENPDGSGIYTPSPPGREGEGVEMSMFSLRPEQLHLPPIGFAELSECLSKVKPSVNHADLKMQEDWTEMFGEPGDRARADDMEVSEEDSTQKDSLKRPETPPAPPFKSQKRSRGPSKSKDGTLDFDS